MPGPKKTPTKILKNRGSWRAGLRGGEPAPDPSKPAKPVWVKRGQGLVYWNRVVKLLSEMGVLTAADGFALGMYCVYLQLWVKEMESAIRSEPDLQRYANQVHKGEKAFGLTPADRAGLVVEKKPVEDSKAKYFKPKIAIAKA